MSENSNIVLFENYFFTRCFCIHVALVHLADVPGVVLDWQVGEGYEDTACG